MLCVGVLFLVSPRKLNTLLTSANWVISLGDIKRFSLLKTNTAAVLKISFGV